MRSIKIYIFLSIIFFFIINATAQTNAKLKVGSPAPAIKVFEWIKGPAVTEFKKGQMYVVEFGATWCVPCGKAIPHLTALAKRWKGKVNVLGVFVKEENKEPLTTKYPAYVTRVKYYIQKQGTAMQYSVAVDDPYKQMENKWLLASGQPGTPSTFLIDKNGKICWIGNDIQQLEKTIEIVDASNYSIESLIIEDQLKKEKEVSYDPEKLLLTDGNGGSDTSFLFRSILAKYNVKTTANEPIFVSKESQGLVQATGISLTSMYMLAYGDTTWNYVTIRSPDGVYLTPVEKTSYGRYWYKPILEVSDPLPFVWNYTSPDNRYNYSLKVPLALNTGQILQDAMRRDLKTYFGYEIMVEEREMPYWKLIKTDSTDRLLVTSSPGTGYLRKVKEDGGVMLTNAITRDIIRYLGTFYGHGMTDHGFISSEDIAPYIDETGITREFDFVLEKAYMSDFKAFVNYINALGFDLAKGKKKMKVVVIHDPK